MELPFLWEPLCEAFLFSCFFAALSAFSAEFFECACAAEAVAGGGGGRGDGGGGGRRGDALADALASTH